VVVDDGVAAALRAGGVDGLQLFVASCAERMAQLFTGVRGTDPSRQADVDLLLGTLEDLWTPGLADRQFGERQEHLEHFFELQPSEDELVDVADIYAFYAVLVARYACVYRAIGDSEDSIRCAHAVLTAMGQLDQNVPDGHYFEDERRYQRRRVELFNRADSGPVDTLALRREDQSVSLNLLSVIQSRRGL